MGMSGALGSAVASARHPRVAHRVGAAAVEVKLGGFLGFRPAWIEGRHAGAGSGHNGSREQEVGPKHGCPPSATVQPRHRGVHGADAAINVALTAPDVSK